MPPRTSGEGNPDSVIAAPVQRVGSSAVSAEKEGRLAIIRQGSRQAELRGRFSFVQDVSSKTAAKIEILLDAVLGSSSLTRGRLRPRSNLQDTPGR